MGLTTSAYDEVAYVGRPFELTHPGQLAVQARLHGVRTASPTACRVLEIGCGDGGNLVPMAEELPGSTFVGIDIAERPIARAIEYADGAGLDNVSFLQANVADLDPQQLGSYDFVIAHGVYSWVPPATRTALLELVRQVLHPDGIAFVSYNAYPGSYVRDMVADVLAYHVTQADTERIGTMAAARDLMQLVATAGVTTPHAQLLATEMQARLERPDWQTYHDELGEHSSPFYFHEFASHAGAHGLVYLSEAHLGESRIPGISAEAAAALEQLSDDVVLREQYADILRNRSFRQTLLRCADAPPSSASEAAGSLADMQLSAALRRDEATPGEAALGGAADVVRFVGAAGVRVATSDPRLAAALTQLADAWPASVPATALSDQAGHDAVRRALLELHVAGAVHLHVAPPRTIAPTDRPLVPAYARWQAEQRRELITTALHRQVRLDGELARELVRLLDGSRDRAALAAALAPMRTSGETDDLPGALDRSLEQLAALGLLVRPHA